MNELLDEHEIRRALRLDADELPPRLDPRFVAAASRASRWGPSTAIVLVAGVAFVCGWIWSEILGALVPRVLALTGVDVLGTLIDVADDVLVRVAPIAQAATAPAVPIAILALAVLATVFERMKGRTDATPS